MYVACVAGVKRGEGRGGGREFGQKTEDPLPPPLYTPATQAIMYVNSGHSAKDTWCSGQFIGKTTGGESVHGLYHYYGSPSSWKRPRVVKH